MTACEVFLRCMGAQSEILEIPLTSPASETSDIIYMRGIVTLCPTKEVNPGSAVIGRISGAPVFVFETFRLDTTIELRPDDEDNDYSLSHHPLPESTVATRHWFHLRNGDTISYEAFGLKIAIHLQRAPLHLNLVTETQTQTPPDSSAMAESPRRDQGEALSITTSYETIATEPLSQPPVEDSETDVDEDDLDAPASVPAPAQLTPVAAATPSNDPPAQIEDAQAEIDESEPQSPSDSPLQLKAQLPGQATRQSDDTAAAKIGDQMLFAMTTPGSASKTYGRKNLRSASRDVSHTPSTTEGRQGMKRKPAIPRPDIYDVEEEKPVKRRKGRLPKVARPDDSADLNNLEDEIVVAPAKSQRGATPSGALTTPVSERQPKKVLFSGYTPKAQLTTFLKRSEVQEIKDVPSRKMAYICVVPSTPLKTTVKVLRSLIANVPLVTEDWVSASKQANTILKVDDYMHQDVTVADRRSLFLGKILFFTTSAKSSYGQKGWEDIVQVAKDAGATSVESGTGITGHEITPKDRVVFLGLDDKDKDAVALIRDHGRIVYSKAMLTKTIFEACFDPEESRIALKT